jgi:hypothetical protein
MISPTDLATPRNTISEAIMSPHSVIAIMFKTSSVMSTNLDAFPFQTGAVLPELSSSHGTHQATLSLQAECSFDKSNKWIPSDCNRCPGWPSSLITSHGHLVQITTPQYIYLFQPSVKYAVKQDMTYHNLSGLFFNRSATVFADPDCTRSFKRRGVAFPKFCGWGNPGLDCTTTTTSLSSGALNAPCLCCKSIF